MAIELNNVASGYSTGVINNNFQELEDYINSNLLNRNGLSPGQANHMLVPLDMNSQSILNVDTLHVNDLILTPNNQGFLDQLLALVDEAEDWSQVSRDWAVTAEDVPVENNLFSSFHYSRKAEDSADQAEAFSLIAESHKIGAQNAEAQAQAFSELGLAAGNAFDLGFVTDDIIYFPTDWGNVA